jgi:AcrR family transcriptional regulator
MASERDALLARVLDEVARRGITDRSLRELARAIGTSHRMLLYHFGSRGGLIAAIVGAVEAAQRVTLRELAGQAESPAQLIRDLWHQVSSDELRPFVRLFFESLAYASPGRGGDQLTSPWLSDTGDVAVQLGVGWDPVDIRLGVATVRGLLIDVLATGDAGPATESLERFIALLEARASRQAS